MRVGWECRDPNSEADEFLKGMVWPRHDSRDEYYLDIGSNLIEKHGLALERYSVWDRAVVTEGLTEG